jgi:hypothetical protein
MSTRREWSVNCRDIAGRRRELTLIVCQDKIALVVPPGETAVLSPQEAGRLRAALREAVVDTTANME